MMEKCFLKFFLEESHSGVKGGGSVGKMLASKVCRLECISHSPHIDRHGGSVDV